MQTLPSTFLSGSSIQHLILKGLKELPLITTLPHSVLAFCWGMCFLLTVVVPNFVTLFQCFPLHVMPYLRRWFRSGFSSLFSSIRAERGISNFLVHDFAVILS